MTNERSSFYTEYCLVYFPVPYHCNGPLHYSTGCLFEKEEETKHTEGTGERGFSRGKPK